MNLQKLHRDINRGAKMKATLRLRSAINFEPNNLSYRNLLGDLYYEAGFLDEAGKFWILNDSEEERVLECIAIYMDSVNNSGFTILNDLKFRGDKNKLPTFAQERMTSFEEDSFERTNSVPRFKKFEQFQAEREEKEPLTTFVITIIIIAIVLFVIVSVFVGAGSIISWIFGG